MATRYARFHADEMYYIEDIADALKVTGLDAAREWVHKLKIPSVECPENRLGWTGRLILIAMEREAKYRPKRRSRKTQEEE